MSNRRSEMAALRLAQQQHLIDQVVDNDKVSRRFGLSLTEAQLLHLLVLRPELRTSRALVRQTGLPTSTVASIVDRLEAAGFVRRTRDAADRRVVNLEPTSKVATIAAAYVDSPMSRRAAVVLDEMSDREIEVVRRYFERINAVRSDLDD